MVQIQSVILQIQNQFNGIPFDMLHTPVRCERGIRFSICSAVGALKKMSPVYIYQNDKSMTSLALSTAHQINTNLCQPHWLKGCHTFVIKLPKTCHPQFLLLT